MATSHSQTIRFLGATGLFRAMNGAEKNGRKFLLNLRLKNVNLY